MHDFMFIKKFMAQISKFNRVLLKKVAMQCTYKYLTTY